MDNVALPLVEPLYATYHNQGSAGAILKANPTVRNWYLNEVMNLCCTRKFLIGTYSSPQINVDRSLWNDNPYIDSCVIPMQVAKECINAIIRGFINNGYYVFFWGIDDYYIEGKTWYKQRHFNHDGLIYGYNQKEKTYSMYAYDQKWVYRTFEISQNSFNVGRKSMQHREVEGGLCGIKVKPDLIELSPGRVLCCMKEYLKSSMSDYPTTEQGYVFGTVVHDYLVIYVDMLANGTIDYKHTDRRVFRLLWEHKKIMLERIREVEKFLGMSDVVSLQYESVVRKANTVRMLYASHCLKRRDESLPIISKMIAELKAEETYLLNCLVNKMEGVLES